MPDQIMEVLTQRRMMSVANLALHTGIEPQALIPLLHQLEADGRVRFALSKCAGTCSSCSSGCGDERADAPAGIDATAIVISLDRRSEDP